VFQSSADPDPHRRPNVGPTQLLPVLYALPSQSQPVGAGADLVVRMMHWGLVTGFVPRGLPGPPELYKQHNVRSDNGAVLGALLRRSERTVYHAPLQASQAALDQVPLLGRCVAVVDGFYEWPDAGELLYASHRVSPMPHAGDDAGAPAVMPAPQPLMPFARGSEPYLVQMATRYSVDPCDPSLFDPVPDSRADPAGHGVEVTQTPGDGWAAAARAGLVSAQMETYQDALRALSVGRSGRGCGSLGPATAPSAAEVVSSAAAGWLEGDDEPEWNPQPEGPDRPGSGAHSRGAGAGSGGVARHQSGESLWASAPESCVSSLSQLQPHSQEREPPRSPGRPAAALPGPDRWARRALAACPMFIAAVYSRRPCPLAEAADGGSQEESPGSEVFSVGVVTTDANAQFSWLHHRQPLALSPAELALWLDPAAPAAALSALINRGAPDALTTPLRLYRVSTAVNKAATRSPSECLLPADEARRARAAEGIGRFFIAGVPGAADTAASPRKLPADELRRQRDVSAIAAAAVAAVGSGAPAAPTSGVVFGSLAAGVFADNPRSPVKAGTARAKRGTPSKADGGGPAEPVAKRSGAASAQQRVNALFGCAPGSGH